MKIYQLFDGMDGEPIGFFKSLRHAEISMETIMESYGVTDPEEIELVIFEHTLLELPMI